MAVLKELILTVSTSEKGVISVENSLNLTVSTLQGCGSLERTKFNSFYFGKVWQS